MKQLVILALAVLFFTACDLNIPIPGDPPEVDVSALRVDLRPQQTPIRSQGSSNTCQTFAAIAALEASYKRLGYGNKNLSEEFMNYMRKNFWLHPIWSEVSASGTNGRENQIGAFGGGSGAFCVKLMFDNGMRVPFETDMPYRTDNYASNPNKFPYRDPRYQQQWYTNSFNLDPANLTRRVLHNDNFHGAAAGRYFPNREDARNTRAIENTLRRKLEVVWDFSGNVKIGDIWRPCASGESGCTGDIAHSMLIVGFDKTDPDPDKHYFIVKNSWGPDHFSTSDSLGFTHISYDMVRRFGDAMAFITLPKLVVDEWEDVQIIGRYNFLFDGHEGILDFYHLPDYWDSDFLGGIPDKRLGTLLHKEMYRVNGKQEGNKITFYYSNVLPNMSWGWESGTRTFEYYYSKDDYMAGFHTDVDGRKYAGVALKLGEGALPDGLPTPRPYRLESYAHSIWEIHVDDKEGTAYFYDITPKPGAPGTFYIEGRIHLNGEPYERLELWMNPGDPNDLGLYFDMGGENITLDASHLNHKPGIVAGHSIGAVNERKFPFYMIRESQ